VPKPASPSPEPVEGRPALVAALARLLLADLARRPPGSTADLSLPAGQTGEVRPEATGR
jgi:hypothetical protein